MYVVCGDARASSAVQAAARLVCDDLTDCAPVVATHAGTAWCHAHDCGPARAGEVRVGQGRWRWGKPLTFGVVTLWFLFRVRVQFATPVVL